MSKWPLLLGVAVLSLGAYLAVHYLKDSYELIPIDATLQEPTKAEQFADWYKFTDPDGQFKVMLPLLPQHASQQVTDPSTGDIHNYSMYVAQTNDEIIYMISLITFPEKRDSSADEQIMRSLVNGMVTANPENKLSSIEPRVFFDKPALDFTITNSRSIIHGRSFIEGQTVYLLTQISNPEIDVESVFNYFVDSFTLENGVIRPLLTNPPQS